MCNFLTGQWHINSWKPKFKSKIWVLNAQVAHLYKNSVFVLKIQDFNEKTGFERKPRFLGENPGFNENLSYLEGK